MTYPIKFRQQVLAIREKEKLTFAQAAERFGVGMASVMRWAKNLNPVAKRNKPATKISNASLVEDVQKWPDAYIYERAERLGVSRSGIEHAMKRLNITRKKRRGSIPKQKTKQEKNLT